jgi:maltooligosyltrehalose trehalohydrolase
MPSRSELGASLGARVEGESTRFALYTTTARSCSVRLFDERGGVLSTLPMEPRGDGLFALVTAEASAGSLYKFVLDDRELPDPYARSLPQGVHGPARVEASRYAWRHGPGVHRPLGEQVIYELHVGAFTPEGTWAAAASRLPSLRELGVTTVELMPVAAFAGERGWGYDGVAPFAPFAPYGTPDALRALVDEAHGLGLGVLLDVVYNHLGPSGNYLPAYSPAYFTAEGASLWGDAPACGRDPMRSLVLDNARYWLEEFRFDGLRLDAAHAIVDDPSRPVLRELAAMARSLPTGKTLIAEDDRNEPDLVAVTGLDGVWADDFHHAVRVTLTGERDGYYAAYEPGVEAIARAIDSGWIYQGQPTPLTGLPRGRPAPHLAASAFVYCLQNHDQVGNRALGERLSAAVSMDAYRMVSALLLFLPMTPLLFMGQEWAASTPFLYFTDHDPGLGAKVSAGRREEFKRFRAFADPEARERIPDPQDRATFERSRLLWEERDRGEHARTLALYHELLSLRRDDPVLKVSTREGLRAEAVGSVLRVIRAVGGEERVLLANFSDRRVELGPPGSRVLLSTADAGGDGLAPWSAVVLA